MTSVGALCEKHTSLREGDVEILRGIEANMQLIADLVDADVFIDCVAASGGEAIVVAQGRPRFRRRSLYKGSVVGMSVYKENEPAVFHAIESGNPVRDLKAVTQENVTVKQDVIPIRASDDRIIGVLIRERDISGSLLREKKFHELARQLEGRGIISSDLDAQKTIMREMHHRVKNSLQLVANMLNLQAQNCKDQEIRRIFEENTIRVLSIASTHDIISMSGLSEGISLLTVLGKIVSNIETVVFAARKVNISVAGEDVLVDQSIVSAVTVVTNELVWNSLVHGYDGERDGQIKISIYSGGIDSTIWVEDDGCGFDVNKVYEKKLGLNLVELIVRDKLNGDFFISSSAKGTRASFSFKILDMK
ncbi:MAG: sensor histidine kinase [Synergistaceae bacterium]|jgi:two-component sensor histidine kinase|nr:sensor histidine kinase [Synergistaceae bacterium]